MLHAVMFIALAGMVAADEHSFFLDQDGFASAVAGCSELTCPYILIENGEATELSSTFALADVIDKLQRDEFAISTAVQVCLASNLRFHCRRVNYSVLPIY